MCLYQGGLYLRLLGAIELFKYQLVFENNYFFLARTWKNEHIPQDMFCKERCNPVLGKATDAHAISTTFMGKEFTGQRKNACLVLSCLNLRTCTLPVTFSVLTATAVINSTKVTATATEKLQSRFVALPDTPFII